MADQAEHISIETVDKKVEEATANLPVLAGGKNWHSKGYIQDSNKVEILEPTKHKFPKLLYNLLLHATPHPSEARIFPVLEAVFQPLEGISVERDQCKGKDLGNYWVEVGKIGEDHETMFSCHVDTQHRFEGECYPVIVTNSDKNEEHGMVYGTMITKDKGELKLVPSPLGADDKVGAWIMLEMIRKKIPGLYMFHIGEERGCIGSRWVRENWASELKGIKRAIAFDRAGYSDVIAHQSPGRCASVTFTNELAKELNLHLPTPYQQFKGDVHGIFTDTASYHDIIAECTNISVGYWNQHSADEHLDAYWMPILLNACLNAQWERLPIVRAPGETGRSSTVSVWRGKRNYTDEYCDAYYNSYSDKKVSEPKEPWQFWLRKEKEVAPSQVERFTVINKCPTWSPEEGWLQGASKEGMLRIIEAWCLRSIGTKLQSYVEMDGIAKQVVDMITEREVLEKLLYAEDKDPTEAIAKSKEAEATVTSDRIDKLGRAIQLCHSLKTLLIAYKNAYPKGLEGADGIIKKIETMFETCVERFQKQPPSEADIDCLERYLRKMTFKLLQKCGFDAPRTLKKAIERVGEILGADTNAGTTTTH
jgi:hypothetical protein